FKKAKANTIRWCHEDTGNNPHYHYLFESPLKVSTMRTYRQKTTIPKGQQHLVIKELRVDEGLSVQDAQKKYMLYMCKGFDVSSKKLYDRYIDGRYIGVPPITGNFYLGETDSLHKEFWDNYKKMKIIGNDKSKANTGTARFISYLEEHLQIQCDSDQKNDTTEKYLRIRYKDIILKQVVACAYHYCRKMDKSCVEIVVKNLVSAGLNRFDDTGLFFKYESKNMEDYFVERMR
uniref:hypothetical protein n=2 Tax=Burkholderiales TaxID=80840 RepID=UPI0040485413